MNKVSITLAAGVVLGLGIYLATLGPKKQTSVQPNAAGETSGKSSAAQRPRVPLDRSAFERGTYDRMIGVIVSVPDDKTLVSQLGKERAEQLRQLLEQGQFEKAANFASAVDENARSYALDYAISRWAAKDYRSGFEWLVKSGKGSTGGVEGFFSAIATNKDPAVLDFVSHEIREPRDEVVTLGLLQGAARGWVASGRISSADMIDWWNEASPHLKETNYAEITGLLSLSARSLEAFVDEGVLTGAQAAGRSEDGLVAVQSLIDQTRGIPERQQEVMTNSEMLVYLSFLGKLSNAGQSLRTAVTDYGTTGNASLDAYYLGGIGASLKEEHPADVARMLASGPDTPAGQALWAGYLGSKSQMSAPAAFAAFSDPAVPERLQALAASTLVPNRLEEDSMGATQAISDLPEGPAKNLYRKEVEKWLIRKGRPEEAKAWATGG
jgi:hypothetical protein